MILQHHLRMSVKHPVIASTVVATILLCLLVELDLCFDTGVDHTDAPTKHQPGPLPKDKQLFSAVKRLTFYRNKRTSARRTHTIPQLSCVGGTAGCKLFTPTEVTCEKLDWNHEKSKHNWDCTAELSDRVKITNVEVTCEGYDYPEDDYILLGSCGIEFTLDYADPGDYHDYSYYKHMDEHEKKMHADRTQAKVATKAKAWTSFTNVNSFLADLYENSTLIGLFMLLVLGCYLLVRFFPFAGGDDTRRGTQKQRPASKRVLGYGPSASAVLTTKKAC